MVKCHSADHCHAYLPCNSYRTHSKCNCSERQDPLGANSAVCAAFERLPRGGALVHTCVGQFLTRFLCSQDSKPGGNEDGQCDLCRRHFVGRKKGGGGSLRGKNALRSRVNVLILSQKTLHVDVCVSIMYPPAPQWVGPRSSCYIYIMPRGCDHPSSPMDK